MTYLEDIDPASSGNDDAPDSPDQVMQWGVRMLDGAVLPAACLEAARRDVDWWNARGIRAVLVSRVCSPWSAS